MFQKEVKTIYCTEFFRVLSGIQWSPHRARLGGEGHATEAREPFHEGEDTSRGHKPRSQAPPFAGRLELGSPLAGNETTSSLDTA